MELYAEEGRHSTEIQLAIWRIEKLIIEAEQAGRDVSAADLRAALRATRQA